MLRIKDTIISEEILLKKFVCDLNSCKGAWCIEGHGGAPLEKEETTLLEKYFEKIQPFLSEKGKETISKGGAYIKTREGDFQTPLVNNKECAYSILNSEGSLECGIENTYTNGEINWKKPISCHLYPIRIKDYTDFKAINYHNWEICDAACELGKSLKVPVFKFLKEALIRKFGRHWYSQLESLFFKTENQNI